MVICWKTNNTRACSSFLHVHFAVEITRNQVLESSFQVKKNVVTPELLDHLLARFNVACWACRKFVDHVLWSWIYVLPWRPSGLGICHLGPSLLLIPHDNRHPAFIKPNGNKVPSLKVLFSWSTLRVSYLDNPVEKNHEQSESQIQGNKFHRRKLFTNWRLREHVPRTRSPQP